VRVWRKSDLPQDHLSFNRGRWKATYTEGNNCALPLQVVSFTSHKMTLLHYQRVRPFLFLSSKSFSRAEAGRKLLSWKGYVIEERKNKNNRAFRSRRAHDFFAQCEYFNVGLFHLIEKNFNFLLDLFFLIHNRKT